MGSPETREQIDGADQRSEARLAHVRGQTEKPGHVVEIGNRRHAARKLGIGGNVADAAAQVGGVGRHEFAEHLGPAGGRPMQADDEAQQRRLAGAVGAEQAQHAAGFEPQRHVIEGNLAVLVNLGELEGFHHQIAGVFGHAIPSSIRTTHEAEYTRRRECVPRPTASRECASGRHVRAAHEHSGVSGGTHDRWYLRRRQM